MGLRNVHTLMRQTIIKKIDFEIEWKIPFMAFSPDIIPLLMFYNRLLHKFSNVVDSVSFGRCAIQ